MTETEFFPHLSDDARVWLFGASRPLNPREEDRLLDEVDQFLEGWKAHGHPLSAAREWRYGRFLLVGVDETVTPPSGCSVDALVRRLRRLEEDLGLEMVGSAPVWYRGGDEGEGDDVLRRVSRPVLRERIAEGTITEDTIVFDPSVTRVGELRDGKWERPARRSWTARYFD